MSVTVNTIPDLYENKKGMRKNEIKRLDCYKMCER